MTFEQKITKHLYPNAIELENLLNKEILTNQEIGLLYHIDRQTVNRLIDYYHLYRLDITKQKLKQKSIEKRCGTCREKYGVDCVSQNSEIVDKAKKTCLQKYGVTTFSQTEEYHNQVDEYMEKRKETYKSKYDCIHPLQNQEIQNKRRTNFLEKYGVEHYSKTDAFKEQIKETCLQKYSANHFTQRFLPTETISVLSSKESMTGFLNSLERKYTMTELANALKCSYSTIQQSIKKYDIQDMVEFDPTRSSGEDEICELLKPYTSVVREDRTILDGKEIDIYLPEFNLGIEYNGIYWHSNLFKDKNYHYEKSILAQKKNIRLIHIYEYEWEDPVKQNILVSLIKISIGKVENKIYARNCEIQEISNTEAKLFNDCNHLQGHRNAQITYGLFYKGKLVQLMSFSKSKYNKNLKNENSWEIIRGCPGSNNIVIGGVSKLFNYFVKKNKPSSVFSYCDFNKFDGKGYEALGMKLVGYTGPDKKIITGNAVLNRDPKKYAQTKNCPCIYGSGSKKYIWTNNQN